MFGYSEIYIALMLGPDDWLGSGLGYDKCKQIINITIIKNKY